MGAYLRPFLFPSGGWVTSRRGPTATVAAIDKGGCRGGFPIAAPIGCFQINY